MPRHRPEAPGTWQRDFLQAQRLPETYLGTAARFFDPLAALLATRSRSNRGTLYVGLNGSQGSGKSTLGDYLCAALLAAHECRALALSLDDFYLTRAQRTALAEEVHPLLQTRGVPGTHDVPLLLETLSALGEQGGGQVAVPRFDKARDDRADPQRWTRVNAPLDVVILEGWCLGASAQPAQKLNLPINTLERDEDPEGIWRSYANTCLREDYGPLHDRLDLWVMLAAPGFDQVLRWRSEQEQKLRDAVGGEGPGLMSEMQLQRFVAHYERHTRQCLSELPAQVDVLYTLDSQRQIAAVRGLEAFL